MKLAQFLQQSKKPKKSSSSSSSSSSSDSKKKKAKVAFSSPQMPSSAHQQHKGNFVATSLKQEPQPAFQSRNEYVSQSQLGAPYSIQGNYQAFQYRNEYQNHGHPGSASGHSQQSSQNRGRLGVKSIALHGKGEKTVDIQVRGNSQKVVRQGGPQTIQVSGKPPSFESPSIGVNKMSSGQRRGKIPIGLKQKKSSSSSEQKSIQIVQAGVKAVPSYAVAFGQEKPSNYQDIPVLGKPQIVSSSNQGFIGGIKQNSWVDSGSKPKMPGAYLRNPSNRKSSSSSSQGKKKTKVVQIGGSYGGNQAQFKMGNEQVSQSYGIGIQGGFNMPQQSWQPDTYQKQVFLEQKPAEMMGAQFLNKTGKKSSSSSQKKRKFQVRQGGVDIYSNKTPIQNVQAQFEIGSRQPQTQIQRNKAWSDHQQAQYSFETRKQQFPISKISGGYQNPNIGGQFGFKKGSKSSSSSKKKKPPLQVNAPGLHVQNKIPSLRSPNSQVQFVPPSNIPHMQGQSPDFKYPNPSIQSPQTTGFQIQSNLQKPSGQIKAPSIGGFMGKKKGSKSSSSSSSSKGQKPPLQVRGPVQNIKPNIPTLGIPNTKVDFLSGQKRPQIQGHPPDHIYQNPQITGFQHQSNLQKPSAQIKPPPIGGFMGRKKGSKSSSSSSKKKKPSFESKGPALHLQSKSPSPNIQGRFQVSSNQPYVQGHPPSTRIQYEKNKILQQSIQPKFQQPSGQFEPPSIGGFMAMKQRKKSSSSSSGKKRPSLGFKGPNINLQENKPDIYNFHHKPGQIQGQIIVKQQGDTPEFRAGNADLQFKVPNFHEELQEISKPHIQKQQNYSGNFQPKIKGVNLNIKRDSKSSSSSSSSQRKKPPLQVNAPGLHIQNKIPSLRSPNSQVQFVPPSNIPHMQGQSPDFKYPNPSIQSPQTSGLQIQSNLQKPSGQIKAPSIGGFMGKKKGSKSSSSSSSSQRKKPPLQVNAPGLHVQNKIPSLRSPNSQVQFVPPSNIPHMQGQSPDFKYPNPSIQSPQTSGFQIQSNLQKPPGQIKAPSIGGFMGKKKGSKSSSSSSSSKGQKPPLQVRGPVQNIKNIPKLNKPNIQAQQGIISYKPQIQGQFPDFKYPNPSFQSPQTTGFQIQSNLQKPSAQIKPPPIGGFMGRKKGSKSSSSSSKKKKPSFESKGPALHLQSKSPSQNIQGRFQVSSNQPYVQRHPPGKRIQYENNQIPQQPIQANIVKPSGSLNPGQISGFALKKKGSKSSSSSSSSKKQKSSAELRGPNFNPLIPSLKLPENQDQFILSSNKPQFHSEAPELKGPTHSNSIHIDQRPKVNFNQPGISMKKKSKSSSSSEKHTKQKKIGFGIQTNTPALGVHQPSNQSNIKLPEGQHLHFEKKKSLPNYQQSRPSFEANSQKFGLQKPTVQGPPEFLLQKRKKSKSSSSSSSTSKKRKLGGNIPQISLPGHQHVVSQPPNFQPNQASPNQNLQISSSPIQKALLNSPRQDIPQLGKTKIKSSSSSPSSSNEKKRIRFNAPQMKPVDHQIPSSNTQGGQGLYKVPQLSPPPSLDFKRNPAQTNVRFGIEKKKSSSSSSQKRIKLGNQSQVASRNPTLSFGSKRPGLDQQKSGFQNNSPAFGSKVQIKGPNFKKNSQSSSSSSRKPKKASPNMHPATLNLQNRVQGSDKIQGASVPGGSVQLHTGQMQIGGPRLKKKKSSSSNKKKPSPMQIAAQRLQIDDSRQRLPSPDIKKPSPQKGILKSQNQPDLPQGVLRASHGHQRNSSSSKSSNSSSSSSSKKKRDPQEIHLQIEDSKDSHAYLNFQSALQTFKSQNLDVSLTLSPPSLFQKMCCAKPPPQLSPENQEVISRIFSFGNQKFNPQDTFHNNLLKTMLNKLQIQLTGNIAEPVQNLTKVHDYQIGLLQALQQYPGPLTLLLCLFMFEYLSDRMQKSFRLSIIGHHPCPFLVILLQIASSLMVLIRKGVINDQLCRQQPTEIIFFLYGGMVCKWFDLYNSKRTEWKKSKEVFKLLQEEAIRQPVEMIATAKENLGCS